MKTAIIIRCSDRRFESKKSGEIIENWLQKNAYSPEHFTIANVGCIRRLLPRYSLKNGQKFLFDQIATLIHIEEADIIIIGEKDCKDYIQAFPRLKTSSQRKNKQIADLKEGRDTIRDNGFSHIRIFIAWAEMNKREITEISFI